MGGEAEIFLGDLHFQHGVGLGDGAEQRAEGLARLEVQRAVLDLHQNIGVELAVQRDEFLVGLHGAVLRVIGRIDEGPPDHHAAMRLQRTRHHIGAFGLGTAIILRPGHAFRIGLHQEAAEIRNSLVDRLRFLFPPGNDARIARIGGLEAAGLNRRTGKHRKIDLDAVRPENARQRRHLRQIGGLVDAQVGIHIVQHRAVDADGGVGTGIIGIALVQSGQLRPVPQRQAGIAALRGAVEIIPVVEQAQLALGRIGDGEAGQGLARLQQAQIGKNTMQHTDIAVARDDRDLVAFRHDAADRIAFVAGSGEVQFQRIDARRGPGRAEQDIAIPERDNIAATQHVLRAAKQAGQTARQFIPRRRQRGGCAIWGNDMCVHGAIRPEKARFDLAVTQPQVVAILGQCQGGNKGWHGQQAEQRQQNSAKEPHVRSRMVFMAWPQAYRLPPLGQLPYRVISLPSLVRRALDALPLCPRFP